MQSVPITTEVVSSNTA